MNEHEHDLSYDRDFAQLDVHNREHRFIRAKPSIPARTRILWAVGWGTAKPPQLWLNLQQTYELRRAEIAVGRRIAATVQPRDTTAQAGSDENPGAVAAPSG